MYLYTVYIFIFSTLSFVLSTGLLPQLTPTGTLRSTCFPLLPESSPPTDTRPTHSLPPRTSLPYVRFLSFSPRYYIKEGRHFPCYSGYYVTCYSRTLRPLNGTILKHRSLGPYFIDDFLDMYTYKLCTWLLIYLPVIQRLSFHLLSR